MLAVRYNVFFGGVQAKSSDCILVGNLGDNGIRESQCHLRHLRTLDDVDHVGGSLQRILWRCSGEVESKRPDSRDRRRLSWLLLTQKVLKDEGERGSKL